MRRAALRHSVRSRLQRLLGGADNLAMAGSSLAGFAIRLAGVVLMTLATVLLTRVMGAEEYGRLAFFLSGSFIVVLLAGLGLSTASSQLIPRYLARGSADTALHFFLAGLVAVAAAAAGGAIVFAALIRLTPSLFGEYDLPWVGIVGLVVTLGLMRFVSDASRPLGFQLTSFVAESVAVRLLLLAILAVYLVAGARLSAGAALVIYVAAQGSVVLGVIILILSQMQPGPGALTRRRWRHYKAWLGVSTAMLVTPVYYFLLFETDILVLGVLAGPYEVGLYQVARRLAELTVFCAGAAASVGLPRLARAHAERRADKLQATVDVMNLIAVGSTGAIALGVVAIGPLALPLFGPEFAQSYPVLVVLALGRFAATLVGPVSDVLLMTGHHRRLGRVNLLFAAVNLGLNLALIPWLGSVGAAIATTTASLSWNAWLYVLVRRFLPVDTSVLHRLWDARRGAAAGRRP